MAGDGKISVTYVVNSSQYNKNIADMKKNMQLLNQEVKTSAQEVNTYGKNIQSLSKQQNTINQALAQSKKILAEYESSLSKNNTSLEKNQKKLGELAKQKEQANKAYKEAVKTYGEESEEALKAKESLDEVSKAYQKQEKVVNSNKNAIRNNLTQIEKTKQEQLKLEQQLEQTNQAISEQGDKFAKSSEKFATVGTALEKAGGSIKDCGEEAQKAGALILTASTALATFAMSAETGFAKVNTLTHDSGESLKKYKQDVYELSDNTGKSVEDLTDALYNAISAGVDYSESVDFMNDVNKVAVGGFGEIADASSALTSLMNIYGYTVKDVSSISDKLFTAQEKGVLTVGEMSGVLGESASSAKAYNVNLDNLLSGYVSLTKAGINVNMANTKMKSLFDELGDTGSNVGKILKEKTGKSFTQLMENGSSLADVMGVINKSVDGNKDKFNALWSSSEAAGAGFIIASEDGKVFNDALDGMTNSAGKCDAAFNEVANTSEFKMKKSINEVKNSFAKLGDSLLPLVDDVSGGISNIADYISKLNPETITAVAKFGALALVFGTVTKVTGSLVGILGKGATGISTLLKIASDTKSLGSFTKAIGSSDTAVGGLVKGLGGLTLTGGAIGLAVAGVGALGTALYMNQKDIEKSEAKIIEMGDTYEDFTGRLRTQESIWTQLFGKEYNIKFGDDYKQALENTETDVVNWVEALKLKQEEINNILNNTEIDDNTKKEQLKTLANMSPETNKEQQMSSFNTTLTNNNFGEEITKQYSEAYSKAYDEAINTINQGETEIANIISNSLDADGNITQDGLDKITKIREGCQDEIAFLQSNDYDTQLAQTESYLRDEQAIYGNSSKETIKGRQNEIEALGEANKKKLEQDKKAIDELSGVSEKEKNRRKEIIDWQIRDEQILTEAKKKSLTRRAMYDSEYATNYNMTVEEISDGITRVIDRENNLMLTYADSSEALKKYANDNGLYYKQIVDENGNMTEVVTTSAGDVVATLSDTSNNASLYYGNMASAIGGYAEAVANGSMTTEEAMTSIQKDLENGKYSAEQFGMTDEEFYAVSQAMIGAKGDSSALKTELEKIPKEVNTKVEAKVYGEEKVTNLWDSLKSIAGKTWDVIVNTATSVGTSIIGKKKESGGSIEKSGIYNINERGIELVDTMGEGAYTLGDAAQGEYAYLPKNSRVTNAVMTTQKMNDMIDKKLANSLEIYLTEMNKILSNNTTGSETNITIDKAYFENKEDEIRTTNNVKRILQGLK